MKKKKMISSLLLSVLLMASFAPVAQATEQSTTESTSSSTSVVDSSSSTLDASSSSTSDSSSVEDSSSSTEESSTSSVGEQSSSSSSTSSVSVEDAQTEAGTSGDIESILSSQGILEKIVGTDNRFKVASPTTNPYRKIVLLRSAFWNGNGYGTGVMIGPDTILTAAHNVYDAESGSYASYVTAYPARTGSKYPYGSYSSKEFYIFRKYKFNGGDSEYDMAVIKLYRSVDSAVGSLTPVSNVSVGQRVQVPGYPKPTSKDYTMYTMFGGVEALEGNLMAYTIDTEGGQSGSPVLNSSNQIVGIHIAGVTDGGVTFNIARRVKADTFRLIDHAKNEKATNLEITNSSEKNRRDTHRLYHPGIQRHLYTQNMDEAAKLAEAGWKYEGPKFKTASTGTPVYRLYHSGTREHIYTTSTNERNILRTRGWRYEGVAWYSSGTKPIYRLYHPGLQVHLYTADKNESDTLRKRGWNYEGVAFYTLQ